MSRAVDEWIGRTDDEAVPKRVQIRIARSQMDEDGYVVCYLTGKRILPGDDKELDHRIPLILKPGGHRESNLGWCLTHAHREKTAQEMAIRAETDAATAAHIGIDSPRRTGLEGRTRAQKQAARHQRFLDSGKLPLPERPSLFIDVAPEPLPVLALPNLRKQRA